MILYVCTAFGRRVCGKVQKCHLLSSKLRPDNLPFFGYFLLLFLGRILQIISVISFLFSNCESSKNEKFKNCKSSKNELGRISKAILDKINLNLRNATKVSGYNKKLTYKPTDTNHQKHSKHKRKIIWFNPPFSKNVFTKIGKSFLSLLDLHFPRNHIYSSIFNRNKIKVSSSCMENIKSVINNHNIKVLNNTTEIEESCNCRNKNNCPVDRKCLTPNIIYEAQIILNQLNYKQRIYIGIAETNFKQRFSNHTKSFNLEHHENDTELSKEYWSIKRNHFTPKSPEEY